MLSIPIFAAGLEVAICDLQFPRCVNPAESRQAGGSACPPTPSHFTASLVATAWEVAICDPKFPRALKPAESRQAGGSACPTTPRHFTSALWSGDVEAQGAG